MTASEQTYFELNYTFYLNLIAFALSGFLLYVYRRGLGSTRSVPGSCLWNANRRGWSNRHPRW